MADEPEVDEVEAPEDEAPEDPEEIEEEIPICTFCGGGPIVQVRGAFIVFGYESEDQTALIYHHLPSSLDPNGYVVICRDICMSCGQISAYVDPGDLPLFREMVRVLDDQQET